MARKSNRKKEAKIGDVGNKKFESLKDRTGSIKKEKMDKVIELDGKKKVEAIKDVKKGIPFFYATMIVAVIAVIAGVLIFTTPGYIKPAAGGPVKEGDVVQIDYTGRLDNGSVFDAGNFTFKVGAGEVIKGVDEAIVGMKMGEKKSVTVKPEEAYGYYDEYKVYDIPLDNEMNRTEKLTVEQFNETFGEEPEVEKAYILEDREWDPMRVVSIQNQTVVLNHEPEKGAVFDLTDAAGNVYGTATVVDVGEVISVHSYPIRGAVVATLIGQGKIADVNETHMIMDFNHPLAGETLTFEVTLLNFISY